MITVITCAATTTWNTAPPNFLPLRPLRVGAGRGNGMPASAGVLRSLRTFVRGPRRANGSPGSTNREICAILLLRRRPPRRPVPVPRSGAHTLPASRTAGTARRPPLRKIRSPWNLKQHPVAFSARACRKTRHKEPLWKTVSGQSISASGWPSSGRCWGAFWTAPPPAGRRERPPSGAGPGAHPAATPWGPGT